jgi:hypothetical protein
MIGTGSCLTQAVQTDTLVRRQIEHLALELEVVPFLGPAHDPFAGRAYDLNTEVVKLELLVCGGVGCHDDVSADAPFTVSKFLISWRSESSFPGHWDEQIKYWLVDLLGGRAERSLAGVLLRALPATKALIGVLD